MIQFLKSLFRRDDRPPYQRGYEVAIDEMEACQPYEVEERLAHLYALADGGFNTTQAQNEFDRGWCAGLSDWEKRQHE